jgi:hypothetical protein
MINEISILTRISINELCEWRSLTIMPGCTQEAIFMTKMMNEFGNILSIT